MEWKKKLGFTLDYELQQKTAAVFEQAQHNTDPLKALTEWRINSS